MSTGSVPKPGEIDPIGLYDAVKQLRQTMDAEEQRAYNSCTNTLAINTTAAFALTNLTGFAIFRRMKNSYSRSERYLPISARFIIFGVSSFLGIAAGIGMSTRPCILKVLELPDESKIKQALREE
jgi:hypothetical protein